MLLEEIAREPEHPLDVLHLVVDVQREAQHAATYRKLHAIRDKVFVELVEAFVSGTVVIGAHRADRYDFGEMWAGLTACDGKTQLEETGGE
jgi:hypothetical protein